MRRGLRATSFWAVAAATRVNGLCRARPACTASALTALLSHLMLQEEAQRLQAMLGALYVSERHVEHVSVRLLALCPMLGRRTDAVARSSQFSLKHKCYTAAESMHAPEYSWRQSEHEWLDDDQKRQFKSGVLRMQSRVAGCRQRVSKSACGCCAICAKRGAPESERVRPEFAFTKHKHRLQHAVCARHQCALVSRGCHILGDLQNPSSLFTVRHRHGGSDCCVLCYLSRLDASAVNACPFGFSATSSALLGHSHEELCAVRCMLLNRSSRRAAATSTRRHRW